MTIQKTSLAELNRLRTTKKVKEALEKLKKEKSPINIQRVSDKAQISRKTIYNRPDLKSLIEEWQSVQTDLKGRESSKSEIQGSSRFIQLERLREKNKALIEEKRRILEQNMHLTKENIRLLNKLADMEKELYSNSSLKVLKKE